MMMRLSPWSLGGVVLVAGMLTVGCRDHALIGPRAGPTLTPSLEASAADAGPDSGKVVIYAPDPGAGEIGAEALADETQPRIRIGVVQTASTVTLGSSGDYTIQDKITGLPLMTGVNGSVSVSLLVAPPSHFRLQVVCGSVSAVATRKAAADAAGYVTFTEFVAAANCTRLYLGQFAPPPANTFAARTAFRNKAIAERHAGTDSFWREVAFGTTIYKLTHGTKEEPSINPVIVSSSTGLVRINGATYRDKGEARRNSGSTLAGINELPIEQYLYGVVPRELGPIAFPQVEAQKAQAIAARTFAMAGLGRRSSDGYDLRATTDDQVYGGYAAEHPLSSAAVDATAGLVAIHNGRPISALYHSTSGGHTADNEEAFASSAIVYLRGVPDSPGGRALERLATLDVFKPNPSAISLSTVRDADSEFEWSRFHRWTFDWTMSQMTTVISAFAGQPVGAVTAINVVQRGPSGRVLHIEYVTEAGTFFSLKDQIRSSLKFFNASGVATNLLSTLFVIEPIHAPGTNALVGYRAYGGGFGHGVGMSQTGAVGMAERGLTYDQILRYYYRGIALTKWY
jgi:stage II sporulation protein D